MAETREIYQVQGDSLEEALRHLNFNLAQIADRLDRFEGLRDNPKFYSTTLEFPGATASGVLEIDSDTEQATPTQAPTLASPTISNATINTSSLSGSTIAAMERIGLLDASEAYDMRLRTQSTMSANRNLTINPGDSDRTITIESDVSLDQDVKTDSNVVFGTIQVKDTNGTVIHELGVG